VLYPQNGGRIVTVDSVASLHPMNSSAALKDCEWRTVCGAKIVGSAQQQRVLRRRRPVCMEAETGHGSAATLLPRRQWRNRGPNLQNILSSSSSS